ncbi:Uncharacterised protein [Mycobacterium tuberculosis]|uniref:Uncharacterized protein n=1 Tax=Mycobacterium tuberculosis TaxID=1773 RepID=A0A654U197_MYCTX|nr:Uncharacterised protein [Mycobacterium tuberculosis]CKS16172.1 Uncharacterised protein [Mycobacterium tuberculosis]CKT39316.1 Uncharacterised protein [Mycobacterium tuberculosis]CKT44192.1 Uncharacterised protein [Mycobacterium tuberculosis]CNW35516.1 Uncharacterised protein [Mycobacterium tuberculosis]
MTPYWRTSATNRSGRKPRDNAIRVPPTTAPPRLTNSADSWCSGVKQYTVSLRPRAAVEAVPKADTAQR